LLHTIAGIVDNPTKSLFTYGPNGGWDTFYNPEYQPAFEVIFLDSDLQAQAQELCGDDSLCLFDIAATGDVGIGATTRESTELQETITELFKPSRLKLLMYARIKNYVLCLFQQYSPTTIGCK